MCEINIIKEGFSKLDDDGFMCANATCVLIISPQNKIIVDTLTPWDGKFILEKIEELNVKPDEIDYVISTHGHSDHTGNNNLFLKAKQHIVGFCISKGEKYYLHPFEYDEPFEIDEFVKIIPTPGHTNEDISIIVKDKNEKTVVICGDLFESEEDLENAELWVGNSFDTKKQAENRVKILKIADFIIPGHGPQFENCAKYLEIAQEFLEITMHESQ